MSEKPEDSEQLAADIRATRRELAETVSALVEMTDVRRQARKGITRLRKRIHGLLAHAHTASHPLTGRKKS
jgi:hypothetical protein